MLVKIKTKIKLWFINLIANFKCEIFDDHDWAKSAKVITIKKNHKYLTSTIVPVRYCQHCGLVQRQAIISDKFYAIPSWIKVRSVKNEVIEL